jgi:hypothetical protein
LWRFRNFIIGVFATDGGLLYGGFEQLEFKQLVFLPLSQLQHLYRIDYLKENNGIESN